MAHRTSNFPLDLKQPITKGACFSCNRARIVLPWKVIIALFLIASPPPIIVGGSRVYPLGCSKEDPSYYDYDNYPFPPPGVPVKSTNDYLLVERLGTGKFSDVFSAVEQEKEENVVGKESLKIDPHKLVVIKCLKPVTDRKIRRELLVLSHASKLPNLARVVAVVLHPDFYTSQRVPNLLPRMPSLVLEHAGCNSQWLSHASKTRGSASIEPMHEDGEPESEFLSEFEIKYFLYHLLIALDALHSKGVMHRDVKPRNILISRSWSSANPLIRGSDGSGPLMLIDLGLADFYLPNTRYNVRVASRHYKSPELLIGYEYYDYGVDLWPVGCILAGLLFRREPFFRGKDNVNQLEKIVSVLGTPDLIAYISKCKLVITSDVRKILTKYSAREQQRKDHTAGRRYRLPWLSFLTGGCPTPSPESLDLLDRLLVYDQDIRLTAQEAMAHPFFDEVRERVNSEVRALGKRNETGSAL